ncbi:GTPase-associated protein 1-related protein [Lipingzhangella sp. LS1_29]|uniref:GTPase-associated protein 1-related protein n=1 Tax=Lipingzhangella rawalii TaxID=2055835 RepID=A0ABU2H7N5_9ACTN|nr:GTPase-associated protein 1-related protein [Lipingzhangella rawalii]
MWFAHVVVVEQAPAHAETRTDDSPDDEPLPIELWDSPVWSATAAESGELPEVSTPCPPGPLNRSRIAAWLRNHPTQLLARLVAAADRAIDGGPPIVLVADGDTVAHWIAAISQTLAPERARRLSFATTSQSSDPGLHIRGVPPQYAPPRSQGILRFDLSLECALADTDTSERAGDVPHPLAVRLAQTGVEFTPTLWQEARELGDGSQASLTDWHPIVLASAALRLGQRLSTSELGLVCHWLPEGAQRMAREEVAELVGLILDALEPTLGDSALLELHHAAERSGATDAAERLAESLALRALDRIVHGGGAPPVVSIRTGQVRRTVTDRVCAVFVEAAQGSAHLWVSVLAELLDWMRSSGLEPPEAETRRLGRDVIAPVLVTRPQDEAVAALVHTYPAIARGVGDALAGHPRSALLVLLRGPAGTVLAGRTSAPDVPPALVEHPRLYELYRIAAAGPRTDPATVLAEIINLRQEMRHNGRASASAAYDLDIDLIRDVWGHRNDPEAVARTLRVLPAPVQVDPEVDTWVTDAVLRLPERAEVNAWTELATELSQHWMWPRLPSSVRWSTRRWEHYRNRKATYEQPASALAELVEFAELAVHQAPPSVEDTRTARAGTTATAVTVAEPDDVAVAAGILRRVVHTDLCAVLLRTRCVETLAQALQYCTEELFRSYCAQLSLFLAQHPAPELAARIYLAAGDPHLRATHPRRCQHLRAEVLTPAVALWRRRDVAALRNRLPEARRPGRSEWSRRGAVLHTVGVLRGRLRAHSTRVLVALVDRLRTRAPEPDTGAAPRPDGAGAR